MKTQSGYHINANHVPSSTGDFASISSDRYGHMTFSVYPISSAELREFAAECLACADKLDAASADAARVVDIFSALRADEQVAA